MSYDSMVFDPSSPPSDREGFMAWYSQQTEWAEDHDIDDPKVTDYSLGTDVIYAAFAWSEAEDAYRTMFNLAEKHRVGFFDVSSDNGGVLVATDDGKYKRIHGG